MSLQHGQIEIDIQFHDDKTRTVFEGEIIKVRSLIGVQQNPTDFLLQELQHRTGNLASALD